MTKTVFVGHGSPMNALGGNEYSRAWEEIGEIVGPVSAILCISAHWYTPGSRVAVTSKPETIHDFYGFPPEMYQLTYPVPGEPALAQEIAHLLPTTVTTDREWGLDHGAWSVLLHMYPAHQNIPVLQLSIDRMATPQSQMAYGRALASLRSKGVLILGSGNIVHNLRLVSMQLDAGYDWAHRFDEHIHEAIVCGNFSVVADSLKDHDDAPLAVPTRDHFDPLLYVLGAVDPKEPVEVYNRKCIMGSISMNTYVFG